MIHEAVHTSLDSRLYNDQWYAAVAADGVYISNYAKEFPNREDVAETYVVWLATRCAKDEFTQAELDQWELDMGARFSVFDKMSLTGDMMSPYTSCSAP